MVPKTYSLNTSDKECLPCPKGAECHGGSNIEVKSGYWRANISSAIIIDCNDDSTRCKGRAYGENLCQDEYKGPVCLQCNTEKDYVSKSDGSCTLCNSLSRLVIIDIVWLLATVAYQLFMLINTFKENVKSFDKLKEHSSTTEEEPKIGAHLIIFTAYTQILTVFSKLVVDGFLPDFFNTPDVVGNPSERVFFSLQYLLFSRQGSFSNRPIQNNDIHLLSSYQGSLRDTIRIDSVPQKQKGRRCKTEG